MNPKLRCLVKNYDGKIKRSDYEDYKTADGILNVKEVCTGGDGTPSSPYGIDVTVTNISGGEWRGVIKFELSHESVNPRIYMPGFMYGTNRGESPIDVPRKYPRIRMGQPSLPASDYWMVRGDRLSAPAALIFDSGHIYGVDAKPYYGQENGAPLGFAGYCCSVIDGAAVGYTLGYENSPWLFVQSTTIIENDGLKYENCICMAENGSFTVHMNIYDFESQDETAIHDVFRNVYTIYHEPPRKIEGFDYKTAVQDIAGAISEYAWLEDEDCYSGFVWEHEDGTFTYNKLGSLSWTNGLSVAVPMLLAGIRTSNVTMKGQALRFIEKVVSECMNAKSGLPFDAVNDGVWSIHGWWFNNMHTGGHSAYLAGQAVYYILKAYYYEQKINGVSHDNWLDFVKPILKVFDRNKNSAGEYPFVFSAKDGSGLEYDSMSGAWCLAAAAYYSYITGDKTYLDSLKTSEMHYYNKYVKISECYGAPLDTDKAVDSEGILAYIRAVRYMHEVTGDEIYLEHLKTGLDYEFTFKFIYNSPVKVPPLSDIGWSSCGGSVTSTANPHIHPMSSTVVDEMLYYYRQTGDRYVLERMEDTVGWGCQTYNTYDGEYGYGRRGWMSERFCYSEGLLVEKYPDGSPASTWFALMPWAGASIVEGLVFDYWED